MLRIGLVLLVSWVAHFAASLVSGHAVSSSPDPWGGQAVTVTGLRALWPRWDWVGPALSWIEFVHAVAIVALPTASIAFLAVGCLGLPGLRRLWVVVPASAAAMFGVLVAAERRAVERVGQGNVAATRSAP
jgi:hypothetical protein